MIDIFSTNPSFRIEDEGLIFEGEFPTPGEIDQIYARVSRRFNFAPLNTIPVSQYSMSEAIEYLNQSIKSYPLSWQRNKKWKREEIFDWGTIHQKDFVERIFSKYLEQYTAFRESLKKNDPIAEAPGGEPENSPELLPPKEPEYQAPKMAVARRPDGRTKTRALPP